MNDTSIENDFTTEDGLISLEELDFNDQSYAEYLYDDKLDLLTKIFNQSHKELNEMIYVDDLFNNSVESSYDILDVIKKLKGLNICSLKYLFNDKYYDIPLKRLFGLANEDDTYASMYDLGYYNSQYPLAGFYMKLTETLDKQLSFESSFEDDYTVI